jgi:hypothetical protein
MAVNRKPVKGTRKLAHKVKAKTPRAKRNQIEREIREGLISDLRATIYAPKARSMVKKAGDLK